MVRRSQSVLPVKGEDRLFLCFFSAEK